MCTKNTVGPVCNIILNLKVCTNYEIFWFQVILLYCMFQRTCDILNTYNTLKSDRN
jgi:hypothetical protein